MDGDAPENLESVAPYFNAISDGGSMIDVIPLPMANELIKNGYISKIEIEPTPFRVQFGKKGSYTIFNQFIRGNGLLDKVSVSDDVSVALVSDVSLTSKGITIVKQNFDIWGVDRNGAITFHGTRSRSYPSRSLWVVDIAALIIAPDPNIETRAASILRNNANLTLPCSAQIALNSVQSFINGDFSTSEVQVYSARPTFSKSQVIEGRRAQRSVGHLPALARTIEVQALRNVSHLISPALLYEIHELKDDIPYILSHRRKFTGGGSGVHTNLPGAVFSMDDQGIFKPSIFGITGNVIIVDRATGNIMNYGFNSKTAIKDIIAVYCQFIYSHGLQVTEGRYDSSSMEKSAEFRSACAHWKLAVVPAPPEQQNKNPCERSWQVIQKDAAYNLVRQNNLSDFWWHAAVTAACTIRNCLVNDASLLVGHQSPWTQITNYSTDYDHLTSGWFGAIGTVPRVGNKRLFGTKNELCVVICPIFNDTHSHLVVLDGHRTPSIRGGFLLIQEEVQRLSIQQIKALEPKFDNDGYLLDFKSPVDQDFTLFDKVTERKYGASEQLSRTLVSELDETTLHMTSRINPGSHPATFDQSQTVSPDSLNTSGLHTAINTAADNTSSNINDTIFEPLQATSSMDDGNERLGPDIISTDSRKDHATHTMITRNHRKPMDSAHINFQELSWDLDQRMIIVNLLEKHGQLPNEEQLTHCLLLYAQFGSSIFNVNLGPDIEILLNSVSSKDSTVKEPKWPKAKRCKVFCNEWLPSVRHEIDGLYDDSSIHIISYETFIKEGYELLGHCIPLKIKSTGVRKARLAVCGNQEPLRNFEEGSLFAPSLSDSAFKIIIAVAAYFELELDKFDVVQCFRNNEWSDTKNPRKIAIKLDSIASGTGKEEFVSIDVNLYGFRDANRTWSDKANKTLEHDLKFIQSRTELKLFYKRVGAGLCLLGLQTDDGLTAYSNNPDGYSIRNELFNHLDRKYKITTECPAINFCGVTISRNLTDHSINLTQPIQVAKVKKHFFGNGNVPETFLPLPIDWTPATSDLADKCSRKVYMSGLGLTSYLRLTMLESNTFSLLSSRMQSPSVIDLDALAHFAAFIYTRRYVGLTYYRCTGPIDFNKCIEFHSYSDGSPNQSGAGQIAWIIKLGPRFQPGAAVVARSIKQPGLVADSVPVLELGAIHHCVKDIIICRHVAEEIAGLLLKDCTDLKVSKSAMPTLCAIDNQSIKDVISGTNGQGGKALKMYNRTISFLRSARAESLINPIGVPTEEQQADILTKQFKSASAYWKAAAGPLGEHPALTDMLHRVIFRNGRSERWKHDGNKSVPVEESIETESADAVININSKNTNFSDLDLNMLFQELLGGRFADEDDYELDRIGHLTAFNTAFNSRIGEGT